MVSADFAHAQEFLRCFGATEHCRLLSISLDPEHDTPELLAAYAQGLQAEPALWTFATGEPKQIRALGGAVGLEVRRKGDRLDHNLRTVVLDAGGHIAHIFRGDKWTPQELVAELQRAARKH
jgi:protein SCO1/2